MAGAVLAADRDRALAILRRHGYATVSFRSRWLALYDGLAAFARGDLLGLAAATVARRRGLMLALILVAAALMATCCWCWW